MAATQIVIVEDDPIIATDLSERLRDLGYSQAKIFASGEEALPALQDEAPSLMLVDVQLAGKMDGIELVSRFSESEKEKGNKLTDATAVVFLTSNTDEKTFARARALNPRAFMGKPFRSRDLKHTIELAIGSPPAHTAVEEADNDQVYRLKDRLFIKVKDRLIRVIINDILFAQADDYYCRVVTAEREYLVTRTLKKFAEVLPTDGHFVRTHRSYIVNLMHVEEIDHAYVHIAGHRVPVSRTAREDMMKALGNV